MILIGNLGRDPEIRTLNDGTIVAKVSLATTETYRLRDGTNHSHTEWHTIVLWRGLAALAGAYLKSGSLVYIEGRIRTQKYDDKEGNRRVVTEVLADQIIMLDKKSPGAARPTETEDFDNGPAPF